MCAGGKRAGLPQLGFDLISWQHCPQCRPNALLLTPADTVVQRVPYAPEASKLQRPAKWGRDSRNFLGAIRRLGSRLLLGRGEGKDSRNSEQPETRSEER